MSPYLVARKIRSKPIQEFLISKGATRNPGENWLKKI